MPQCNDLRSTRVQLGHNQGGLIGFRTAVGEVALLQAPRCNLSQLFRQLHDGLVDVKRRGMLHLLHLCLDGRIDFGMAVADAHGKHATKEVQVRSAFGIPDPHAFGTFHHQRFAVVGVGARPDVLLLFGNGIVLSLRGHARLLVKK